MSLCAIAIFDFVLAERYRCQHSGYRLERQNALALGLPERAWRYRPAFAEERSRSEPAGKSMTGLSLSFVRGHLSGGIFHGAFVMGHLSMVVVLGLKKMISSTYFTDGQRME